jgi:transposase
MEQRVNIKFCYKLGKTATETHEMLVHVYRTEAVSRKSVYDWFKRFRDGKETTEDEPRSGRPSTSRTPDTKERVRQMLTQDRRVSLRLLSEELGISKSTVHTIVREDLGKRKVCSLFVPHTLTDEQKAKRMETSGDFITMCDQNPSFLRSIVTGDETWCYQYDPQSKRQSMEWRSPSSPRPKNSRLLKSKIKTMLIAFFDINGIIHKEFVPEGQTVNSEFYEQVLLRLLQRIVRVRPQLYRSGQWMLLHDNAPAHSSIRIRQLLARRGVPILDHPPYSPDLAPADFFVSPSEDVTKGARFADVAAIQECVTAILRSISKEAFAYSFQKLYECCKQCVVKDGNYFEGQ